MIVSLLVLNPWPIYSSFFFLGNIANVWVGRHGKKYTSTSPQQIKGRLERNVKTQKTLRGPFFLLTSDSPPLSFLLPDGTLSEEEEGLFMLAKESEIGLASSFSRKNGRRKWRKLNQFRGKHFLDGMRAAAAQQQHLHNCPRISFSPVLPLCNRNEHNYSKLYSPRFPLLVFSFHENGLRTHPAREKGYRGKRRGCGRGRGISNEKGERGMEGWRGVKP